MSKLIQKLKNQRRLKKWRRRYLIKMGRNPDILAHAKQKEFRLVFPLPGFWPTPTELVTARSQSNINQVKVPRRSNRLIGHSPTGPVA